MYSVFISCGFVDVTKSVNLMTGAGLKAGDVLLNTQSHTELMISATQCAGASINEHGHTTGGQPGDQTGKEFRVRNYYNFPWTHVLRYNEETHNPEETGAKTPAGDNVCSAKIRTVRFGSQGPHVAALQAALAFHGFDPVYVDGTAGQLTITKLTAFQKDKGLQADGIAGPQTYAALY